MLCPNCKKRNRLVLKITSNSANPNAPKKDYVMKWCRRCRKEKYDKPYLKYRKEKCEFCGFMPVNMCQLDVDHIDGNHSNNSPENLQTLCANCHRLKTYVQRYGGLG